MAEQFSVDESRIDYFDRAWLEPLGTDMKQSRRVEVRWSTVE